jgi:hypothetical protein
MATAIWYRRSAGCSAVMQDGLRFSRVFEVAVKL